MSIRSAIRLYTRTKPAFAGLQRRCMERDFSWDYSANKYLEIYARV